jgi:DNA polymerase-4
MAAEELSAELDQMTRSMSRKIVHVDMDAFYASVEQRDNPELRGKPVVVAWKGKRSVVCAASYEARRFGVRSAMPAVTAERMCPNAIFVPPDFARYKAASQGAREIFQRHTDLIEPLSLDEAYLDVTENKLGLATATRVAKMIREQIREELNLTASAGVAQNKFLAKIASDWKKPNGLFVIRPHEAQSFLLPLPVGRVPGVGQVTEARMKTVGMTKSISAEDTFETDISLAETELLVRKLAEKVWAASRQNARMARTVVLKLKTKEFNTLTRSLTPPVMPASLEEFTDVALSLRERVELGSGQLFRLVGVGLSNFQVDAESTSRLFEKRVIGEVEAVFASNE